MQNIFTVRSLLKIFTKNITSVFIKFSMRMRDPYTVHRFFFSLSRKIFCSVLVAHAASSKKTEFIWKFIFSINFLAALNNADYKSLFKQPNYDDAIGIWLGIGTVAVKTQKRQRTIVDIWAQMVREFRTPRPWRPHIDSAQRISHQRRHMLCHQISCWRFHLIEWVQWSDSNENSYSIHAWLPKTTSLLGSRHKIKHFRFIFEINNTKCTPRIIHFDLVCVAIVFHAFSSVCDDTCNRKNATEILRWQNKQRSSTNSSDWRRKREREKKKHLKNEVETRCFFSHFIFGLVCVKHSCALVQCVQHFQFNDWTSKRALGNVWNVNWMRRCAPIGNSQQHPGWKIRASGADHWMKRQWQKEQKKKKKRQMWRQLKGWRWMYNVHVDGVVVIILTPLVCVCALNSGVI